MRTFPTLFSTLFLGLALAGCGDEPPAPFVPVGNVDPAVLPSRGSVGFILVDGDYRLFRMPGMVDTSINFVSADAKTAYGWAREVADDDPSAREIPFALDLVTNTFRRLEIPGAGWAVVRNGSGDGIVVGKLGLDPGTPADRSDDEVRGFSFDVDDGTLRLFEREGYEDIGISGIARDGTMVGFNDFGMQGFVLVDGAYRDLDHPDAFRLFPMDVGDDGTIVGFWGSTSESWYDSATNPAFVARPNGAGYDVERVALAGFTGVAFTGITAHGTLAGLGYRSSGSLPVVLRLASLGAEPEVFPLGGDLEPFPTGIQDRGYVYGQAFILEEPPVCGGHGALDGETCDCDLGFVLDPYDAANCVDPTAPCDGHGHLHGDACHCDEGFEQASGDATHCVPAP